MSKVLFFTWQGGGNQPPAIGLAQQLRRRGHDVLFAGYADQQARFRALDFEFATMSRSGEAWGRFDPADLMPLLVEHVWACQDHLADASDALDRTQPDLVVIDCLMGGVLAALEGSRVAAVALVHSAPGALAPPGGPIDAFVIDRLNQLRSARDLEPVDSYWAAWRPHHVVCASLPELDALAARVPASFTWVGPIFEDPNGAAWAPARRAGAPLVLVSFSSGAAWDQTSRIQRTIEGLDAAGVQVIVTTGSVDPARLRVPSESTTALPYLPHSAVLPHVAAVVTHAGHGTLSAALAHGVPVVAIPNLAADQPALAAQVARLGAGIHLADASAEPPDIARAVRTVLTEPAYTDNARDLANRIRSYHDRPSTVIEQTLGLPAIAAAHGHDAR